MQENPTPQRRYPWRGGADPDRANYDESGIDATSTVGCFPGGASPYGAEDLSGNVWEWTRSLQKAYPYDSQDGREDLKAGDDGHRVVRGGSFGDRGRLVRCAYRNWDFPFIYHRRIGFRVVVAPVDSVL